MQHGHAVAEARPEVAHQLGGEPDLGHQHQHLLALLQHPRRGLQVDLGLARAGDPVQQHGAGFSGGQRVEHRLLGRRGGQGLAGGSSQLTHLYRVEALAPAGLEHPQLFQTLDGVAGVVTLQLEQVGQVHAPAPFGQARHHAALAGSGPGGVLCQLGGRHREPHLQHPVARGAQLAVDGPQQAVAAQAIEARAHLLGLELLLQAPLVGQGGAPRALDDLAEHGGPGLGDLVVGQGIGSGGLGLEDPARLGARTRGQGRGQHLAQGGQVVAGGPLQEAQLF